MTEPAVLNPMLSYRSLKAWKYEVALPGGYVIDTPICPTEDVSTEGPNPWIRLTKEGRLFVRDGYMWDGPSGPTFDTPNFMAASLVHDAFYQLMRKEKLTKEFAKDKADRLLAQMCRDRGMSSFRSWYVYWGVRLGGGKACEPGPDPYDPDKIVTVK